MPALRGHHLVCLHFFRGEGYSREFVENLRDVLGSVQDREIEVVQGSDDVCAKCPSLRQGRCLHSGNAEEGIRKMDREALALLKVSRGMKVMWAEIGEKMSEIFPAWFESCCTACSWKWACERNELYLQLTLSLKR